MRPRDPLVRAPFVASAAHALALFATLALLASHAFAQRHEPDAQDPAHPDARMAAPDEEPGHAFELALGADGLAFGYRNAFHRGRGHGALGLFVGEDNDVALHARILRYGEPAEDTPLALGIGLGAFAAFVDESNDELAAITLTGSVEYTVALEYPIRLGLEASYSPSIATFFDGDRVLDLLARAEADLSSWATAFVGYRHLAVDLEEGDAELDGALQVGIRLGF